MNDTESKGLIPEAMAREYERLEAEEKGRTAAEQADAKGRRGKMAAYEWGVECERLAMEHLVREGYAIREMRWSPGAGKYEIDIIAELPGVIVFVEVKGRRPYEGQTREQWAADPVSPAAFVDLKR